MPFPYTLSSDGPGKGEREGGGWREGGREEGREGGRGMERGREGGREGEREEERVGETAGEVVKENEMCLTVSRTSALICLTLLALWLFTFLTRCSTVSPDSSLPRTDSSSS